MKYDEALKLWGATKVANSYGLSVEEIDASTVTVEFSFNEGYTCCGGSNPDCYCSFYESPSSDVFVLAKGVNGVAMSYRMDVDEFDFVAVLGELCEVGQGKIVS